MGKKDVLQTVLTDSAAIPQGHYSQAIIHNNVVYVAMQIAIDPHLGVVYGTSGEQAKVALTNIKNILESAGSSLNRVLRVTVYISDISMWNEVNEVYKEFFGNHKPARGVVSVNKLHLDLDVGFEVTAAI